MQTHHNLRSKTTKHILPTLNQLQSRPCFGVAKPYMHVVTRFVAPHLLKTRLWQGSDCRGRRPDRCMCSLCRCWHTWQNAARLHPQQEKYGSHEMNLGHNHQTIGKRQQVSGRLVAPPAASKRQACTSSSATHATAHCNCSLVT
jgi:hypothetical protein